MIMPPPRLSFLPVIIVFFWSPPIVHAEFDTINALSVSKIFWPGLIITLNPLGIYTSCLILISLLKRNNSLSFSKKYLLHEFVLLVLNFL